MLKQFFLVITLTLLTACGGSSGGDSGTGTGGNTGSGSNSDGNTTTIRYLKKTGQTISVNDDGDVVDGSIKDDGYYQTGTTPVYTRDNSKNIVSDQVTLLQWEDDGAPTQKIRWSDAINYCETLTLGGNTDWRLPTGEELYSIVDLSTAGKANAYMGAAFENKQDYLYWTSSTVVGFTVLGGEEHARQVNFFTGHQTNSLKSGKAYVRCTRGLKTVSAQDRFSRDNSGIVTDNSTGLMWQDNIFQRTTDGSIIVKANSGHRDVAVEYCDSLSHGGYEDWRLPNIIELRSIMDDDKYMPAIDTSIFQNFESKSYWSSTPYLIVDFSSGYTSIRSKYNSLKIRCIRAGL